MFHFKSDQLINVIEIGSEGTYTYVEADYNGKRRDWWVRHYGNTALEVNFKSEDSIVCHSLNWKQMIGDVHKSKLRVKSPVRNDDGNILFDLIDSLYLMDLY